ncbi:MFS transporter [Actinoplanes cyaneus]|uniref:MFS transporter n=1 Tax=Actinoplanes cyaneus TaxID=52696 RepID=A0A919IQ14_9ACTN|nr:MFS transporter [Actinoplanes cyaneus]MCW2142343.1 Sugar phosphate permease [Actinoplanes cyaneus]GID69363.1 MFS transporter [Actinoplanes cyaneus]
MHPSPRRWLVLAIGMIAMTSGCAFQFGLAYLIPALRADGLSLATAGLLAAAPTAGLLTTLIAWGAAADRWGERLVLSAGLAASGAILLVATRVQDPVRLGVCFLLAGAAGAAVHASSGRLIMGWFRAGERGLAMGLRQTAQPAGVAVAAVALPALSASGPAPAIGLLAALSLASSVLVAVLIRDPARTTTGDNARTDSPYRTPVLWRVHAASALLIVPQFTVAMFALVFLVDQHHFTATAAGRVLAAGQVGGAVARLAAGWWSDRTGSRLRPMRTVALAIVAVVALLAATAPTGISVAVLLAAAVLTVSPNGLAFTAVAEYAGQAWAGRALGIQNTAQNVVGTATPPTIGAVIGAIGYGPAFATILIFPLLAAAIIPVEPRPGRRQPESPGTPAVSRA